MTLHQWDIVKVLIYPQDRDEHLAIILSPTEIASDDRFKKLNVIYGTTHRPNDSKKPGQILLDDADGCDHLTRFDCIFFPVVLKSQIRSQIGSVCAARRRSLHQEISGALRLFQ